MDIRIDYREKASGLIELFKGENVSIEVCVVPYGDYVVNRSVTIERKTAKDFLVSIIDGRLFSQLSNLKKHCINPILLVEGDLYNTRLDFKPAAIRGALISVQVIWRVPVIFSRSKEDTRDIILVIGNQDERCADTVQLRGGYRPKKMKSKQLYILQGLPKVGATLAKRLLEHFKSKVMRASVKELVEIEGIGKTTAKTIRDILDCENI